MIFTLPKPKGACAKVANVCQHQGIPPPRNQEEVSQIQKGKVFFPRVSPALQTFY